MLTFWTVTSCRLCQYCSVSCIFVSCRLCHDGTSALVDPGFSDVLDTLSVSSYWRAEWLVFEHSRLEWYPFCILATIQTSRTRRVVRPVTYTSWGTSHDPYMWKFWKWAQEFGLPLTLCYLYVHQTLSKMTSKSFSQSTFSTLIGPFGVSIIYSVSGKLFPIWRWWQFLKL